MLEAVTINVVSQILACSIVLARLLFISMILFISTKQDHANKNYLNIYTLIWQCLHDT